ncbi:phospholipase A2-like [Odontomachus brunneus]|uniref:phospholipase A2-like n=1 Tax=Odontomachus brunneus TaxID=486640 RepID=UPI0013F1E867|nr:phospholipase A2-like [Odontomachus brunneus]
MSHLRSFLLVLGVVVSGLANDDVCNEKVAPGSELGTLSFLERRMKNGQDFNEWTNKWWPFKMESEKANISPLNFADAVNTYNSLPNVEKAFIPPGLKWCGDGDRAKDYEDLGRYKDTDMCCRDHDHCKNNMVANGTLENLKNNGPFTRSACYCDFEFHKCLKKANSFIANRIGKMYFNTLGPQCFSCICPTDECKEDDKTECKDKCIRYKWIDALKY